MNKRGQFFLVAALVIILLIAGVTTVYNSYTKTEEEVAVYDLSKELKYETVKIIDRGVYNSLSSNQLEEQVRNFSEVYKNLNSENDLIIVYGNQSNVTIATFINKNLGEIMLDLGTGTFVTNTVLSRPESGIYYQVLTSEDLAIRINNNTYNFKIKPGQNFYMVLQKQKGDERIVTQ
jgi:hypothetical protein